LILNSVGDSISMEPLQRTTRIVNDSNQTNFAHCFQDIKASRRSAYDASNCEISPSKSYITQTMRFSFLLAVVTSLTASTSVLACVAFGDTCTTDADCCTGLCYPPDVSMSSLLCIPMTYPLRLVTLIVLGGLSILLFNP